MKHIVLFIISLLFCSSVVAQKKVIDAVDQSPISAASIFDAAGNMVGLTLLNGDFPEIPASSFPITLRCLGYEPLTIEHPLDKTWEMTPMAYEMEELIVVPVKRNVLKQTFYVREYFSIYNAKDSMTLFFEYMAHRFVPTTKDAKFGGNSSLRILNKSCYSRYKVGNKDSVAIDYNSKFPSLLSVFDSNNKQLEVAEELKAQKGPNKLYQKTSKSGMSLIQKQNAQTFTSIEDFLANKNNHTFSPLPFKIMGMTMDINQLFLTHTYRANDSCVYLPKDLLEAGFVMEAIGRGKHIRRAIKSENPVDIRSMVELYLVDSEYLSNKEAKAEYHDKEAGLMFEIPASVPPLNAATKNMIERAKKEAKIKL